MAQSILNETDSSRQNAIETAVAQRASSHHHAQGKVLGKKGDENLPKNVNSTKQAREEELQRREKLAVDYRNIISNNKKAKEKAEEARMVTGNIGFLTHKRAYELEETSKTASAADAKDDGNESSDCDEDDSEVPPLM
eukprot:jgi/Bigna1/140076/aug1.54_g14784